MFICHKKKNLTVKYIQCDLFTLKDKYVLKITSIMFFMRLHLIYVLHPYIIANWTFVMNLYPLFFIIFIFHPNILPNKRQFLSSASLVLLLDHFIQLEKGEFIIKELWDTLRNIRRKKQALSMIIYEYCFHRTHIDMSSFSSVYSQRKLNHFFVSVWGIKVTYFWQSDRIVTKKSTAMEGWKKNCFKL